MKGHILIVEDDPAIATGLTLNLKLEGYTSVHIADGALAMAAIIEQQPDLVLLDLSLPNRDGFSVLDQILTLDHKPAVIVVSARDGEFDKVAALRSGADDYVSKPFSLAELMARISAVLRRLRKKTAPGPEQTQTFSDIKIDFETRTVTKAEAPLHFTHLEFELLCFFLKNPGRVVTRDELLKSVWGSSGTPRTVDNFVLQLRSKLENDPDAPQYFLTVRGSGYRFTPDSIVAKG